jgi:hypothetical protein
MAIASNTTPIDNSQIYTQFENAKIIFLKKEFQHMLQITLNITIFLKSCFMLRGVEGYSVAGSAEDSVPPIAS